MSHETDISETVNLAINTVRGKQLADAVFAFALYPRLIILEKLRERVLENAREFPMSHLFGASFLSHDGRVLAHKPPLIGGGKDVDDSAMESEIICQIKLVDLPLRASGFIVPCRKQIWDEHRPSEAELAFLVENNPFIPPGHEHLYLRGIHAGFHNDMVMAAHLLVPQIEESIRYVLGRAGVVTSKLDSKLVQEERLLGVLLNMPETAEIFGKNSVFELRTLLIEKFGFDLRNRLAHGFITSGECFGVDVVLLWWLVVRLCAYPVYKSLGGVAKGVQESEEDQSEKKS